MPLGVEGYFIADLLKFDSLNIPSVVRNVTKLFHLTVYVKGV